MGQSEALSLAAQIHLIPLSRCCSSLAAQRCSFFLLFSSSQTSESGASRKGPNIFSLTFFLLLVCITQMLMSGDGGEDGVRLSKDKPLRRIFTDDISQKDFFVRPFERRVFLCLARGGMMNCSGIGNRCPFHGVTEGRFSCYKQIK